MVGVWERVDTTPSQQEAKTKNMTARTLDGERAIFGDIINILLSSALLSSLSNLVRRCPRNWMNQSILG